MGHGGPRLSFFCVLPPIPELPSVAPQGRGQRGGRQGRRRESVSSAAVVVRWGQVFSMAETRLPALCCGVWGVYFGDPCHWRVCSQGFHMKGVHWRLPSPGRFQPLSAKVTRQQALSHEGLCQDGLQLLGKQQEYPCISHGPVADAPPTPFVTWRLPGLGSPKVQGTLL